jgi:hypothetical protein
MTPEDRQRDAGSIPSTMDARKARATAIDALAHSLFANSQGAGMDSTKCGNVARDIDYFVRKVVHEELVELVADTVPELSLKEVTMAALDDAAEALQEYFRTFSCAPIGLAIAHVRAIRLFVESGSMAMNELYELERTTPGGMTVFPEAG